MFIFILRYVAHGVYSMHNMPIVDKYEPYQLDLNPQKLTMPHIKIGLVVSWRLRSLVYKNNFIALTKTQIIYVYIYIYMTKL